MCKKTIVKSVGRTIIVLPERTFAYCPPAFTKRKVKRMAAKMTEKQKRFANEYIIDLNATRAYKAAYPNIKNDETAAVNGSRLLRLAKVNAYVTKRLEKIKTEKTADAQEVLEYLSAVLRGETETELIMAGDPDPLRVKKHPDEKERLKAAELLAKRYGLLTDNIKLEGDVGVQILNDIPKNNS